ncbi:UNVERIFIED_CONTAM: hypothetical protein GTU68_020741 [Idotea baltica]|nr:hypothetical protein [Idotea baltica]
MFTTQRRWMLLLGLSGRGKLEQSNSVLTVTSVLVSQRK